MEKTCRERSDRCLFNQIAHTYSKKDLDAVSSAARQFQLMSLFHAFRGYLGFQKEVSSIIELGCGAGANAKYLAGRYNKYLGIDYSEKLIELASERYSDDKIEFMCADIKDVSLYNRKADIVFGIGVLHHLDNLNEVLKNIVKISDSNTLFGFIEPQGANPVLQFLRRVRMIVDKAYSREQIFFRKKHIYDLFESNNYDIVAVKYQGYFTPPFAQIILKPRFIFKPLVKLAIIFDKYIQSKFNLALAWNVMWIARKSNL